MKNLLFLSVLMLWAAGLSAQVTQGLVSSYSFNSGQATDGVGNHHGVVHGAVTTADRFNNAGMALYFDGVDDYLELAPSNTMPTPSGSVSLWAKMTALSNEGSGYSYNPIFLAKNSAASSYFEGCGLYVSIDNQKALTITTQASSTQERYFFTANPVLVNDWVHYVITYNSDSLSLYRQGKLENRIYKGFISSFLTTNPILIGGSQDVVNDRFFHGAVDDINVYDRVLNDAEIMSLYQAANPTLGLSNTSIEKNPISVYPNPSVGMVHFSSPVNARLVNTLGETLQDEEYIDQIDLSDYPAGVYYVFIWDEATRNNQSVKLIKE
ncbi:hypothetical protein KFE98_01320 [bacterium SCSIO 12741]|nr:hypothetical protein KFE98_01320 [bacterium SCSIO 12741]